MRQGGRQKGTPNKRTGAAIERAEDTGLLPLDIMLKNARWAQEEADKALAALRAAPKGDFADAKSDLPAEHLKYRRLANEFSKDAAPYIHSKLSSVDQKLSGTVTLEQLVTESYGAPGPQPTAPQPQTVKH